MVWTAEEKERLHEELNRLEAEHLATAASIMPRNDSSQIASPASMVPRENTLQPYPSETHTSLTNQYVKQQKWLQRKQSHTLELRRDKESEELKQCIFQPNINRSRSHAHSHRSSTGDVVERLFDAHEEAAARMKQIRQVDEQRKMKECTFRPAIVEDAWTDFGAGGGIKAIPIVLLLPLHPQKRLVHQEHHCFFHVSRLLWASSFQGM